MCGIVGIYNVKEKEDVLRRKALDMALKIRHRGPDWSGIFQDEKCVLAHERLSIVDVEHGAQPLYDVVENRVLAVNGEIYNHRSLRKRLKKKHKWQTNSDCEVILYLYDEYKHSESSIKRFLNMLNGIFAFILYDNGDLFVARDHIGIVPLYYGKDKRGQMYFASELKALDGYCNFIEEFPPGHYYYKGKFVKWYSPKWMSVIPRNKVSIGMLRRALEKAVKRQLMSDVPYGVLLSGGLDSSIIAAIAVKYRKRRIETGGKKEAWWPQLHSFSIGLKGSPDNKAARKVADYIGTVHHEFTYTIDEGVDAIKDVIRHIETWDVTTVRASTPMYLLARKIRSMGIKMVLSGEGSDEVFGGYLYFHMAPNPEEFHKELVRKITKLSRYDCLRANKSMSAWGIEARVPFLDVEFLEVAMNIDPGLKMCNDKIEKNILREAFKEYLPEEILWRQKEQFSDGVGYGWIDYLKDLAEKKVSDDMMRNAKKKFPYLTPYTKEEYMYREIFESIFTKAAVGEVKVEKSIACSTEVALRWSKLFNGREDPSGRAVVGVHKHEF